MSEMHHHQPEHPPPQPVTPPIPPHHFHVRCISLDDMVPDRVYQEVASYDARDGVVLLVLMDERRFLLPSTLFMFEITPVHLDG